MCPTINLELEKELLKLKDQFEKTCFFFQEIFGLIESINL